MTSNPTLPGLFCFVLFFVCLVKIKKMPTLGRFMNLIFLLRHIHFFAISPVALVQN